MTRVAGAIQAVRDAIIVAADFPPYTTCIGEDDDLVDDLDLNEAERESLSLIVEEVFSVTIPEELWNSPLYRSVAGLADWLVRKTEEASWSQARSMSGGSRAHGSASGRRVGGR